MKILIATLTKLQAWEIVPQNSVINVLDSTWALKSKRYQDGKIRKFKAKFCCRGDQQVQGFDYFDTFMPVVSWNTVIILQIISVILGLDTKQVDYTCAFLHLSITEDVYVHMPRGFEDEGKVFTLRVATIYKKLF